MERTIYITICVLLGILLILTIPYAWKVISIILFPKGITLMRQLAIYQWVALGCVIYFIIQHYVRKNLVWFQTFTHELTHITVAILFLRKIHSFHAEEGNGEVMTSGNHAIALPPVSLAPYCLPIFTYLLLFLRCLITTQGLWVFDIFLGITLAFHLGCFKAQTGTYQTDINKYPLYFSYLYIWTARLINFCIIWVAFFPQYNVFTSFWRYICAIWENLCWVWS